MVLLSAAAISWSVLPLQGSALPMLQEGAVIAWDSQRPEQDSSRKKNNKRRFFHDFREALATSRCETLPPLSPHGYLLLVWTVFCSNSALKSHLSHFPTIFLLEHEDYRTGFWAAFYPGYQQEKCWGLSKCSSPRQPGSSFILLQSCFCWASRAEMQGEKRRICLKTALGRNEGSLSMEGSSSAGSQLTKCSHRHSRPVCKMRLKISSQSNFCRATEPCPCKGFWAMACTTQLRQLCCHAKSHQPTSPDASLSIYLQLGVWINSPRGCTCTKDHFLWTKAMFWQQNT